MSASIWRIVLSMRPEAASKVREMVENGRICRAFLTFDLLERTDAVCVISAAVETARAAADVRLKPSLAVKNAGPASVTHGWPRSRSPRWRGHRPARSTIGIRGQVQPRQAFFREDVPRRCKPRSSIECADMEMHFGRAFTFARQSGPTPCAEPAQPAGGRSELRYLAFGDRISVMPERYEDGDRCSAMPATALAVAPGCPYRLPCGDEPHCATQAAAFDPIAHPLILSHPDRRTTIRPISQSAARPPSTPESPAQAAVH